MFFGKLINLSRFLMVPLMKFTRVISSSMSNRIDMMDSWLMSEEFSGAAELSPSEKWIWKYFCRGGWRIQRIDTYPASSGASRATFMEESSPSGTNTIKALLKSRSGDFWLVMVSKESNEYRYMIQRSGMSSHSEPGRNEDAH